MSTILSAYLFVLSLSVCLCVCQWICLSTYPFCNLFCLPTSAFCLRFCLPTCPFCQQICLSAHLFCKLFGLPTYPFCQRFYISAYPSINDSICVPVRSINAYPPLCGFVYFHIHSISRSMYLNVVLSTVLSTHYPFCLQYSSSQVICSAFSFLLDLPIYVSL